MSRYQSAREMDRESVKMFTILVPRVGYVTLFLDYVDGVKFPCNYSTFKTRFRESLENRDIQCPAKDTILTLATRNGTKRMTMILIMYVP